MKLILSLLAVAGLSGCVGYGGAVAYGPGVYYGPNNGPYSSTTYYDGGYWGTPHNTYRSRDQDRDGVPNRYDRDRDGDGVSNRNDAYPSNPRRR